MLCIFVRWCFRATSTLICSFLWCEDTFESRLNLKQYVKLYVLINDTGFMKKFHEDIPLHYLINIQLLRSRYLWWRFSPPCSPSFDSPTLNWVKKAGTCASNRWSFGVTDMELFLMDSINISMDISVMKQNSHCKWFSLIIIYSFYWCNYDYFRMYLVVTVIHTSIHHISCTERSSMANDFVGFT